MQRACVSPESPGLPASGGFAKATPLRKAAGTFKHPVERTKITDQLSDSLPRQK